MAVIGYLIAGGVAGLVTAGYNTMAPRSQLYGRTFVGSGRGRQLALTFDDGPNDPHTLRLLEVLARHEVRATFFVLGQFVKQRPDILREVAHAGHVIGNHTYNHPNLIFSSRARVEAQIRDCERAIAEALGESSHPLLRFAAQKGGAPTSAVKLFRPPYGGRRPGVLRTARRLGYVPVMWSVSGWDWRAESAGKIEHAIARQLRGGDVILLHDGGHERMGADRGNTVIATERIVARYKAEGYEFVTVPEMIESLSH